MDSAPPSSICFSCEFSACIYLQEHAGLAPLPTKDFCFPANVFPAQRLSNDVRTLPSAAAAWRHLEDVWRRQAVTVRL